LIKKFWIRSNETSRPVSHAVPRLWGYPRDQKTKVKFEIGAARMDSSRFLIQRISLMIPWRYSAAFPVQFDTEATKCDRANLGPLFENNQILFVVFVSPIIHFHDRDSNIKRHHMLKIEMSLGHEI
jgi:hypothetical protein